MKVTITRAQNGWILEEDKPFENDEGTCLSQEVFEDDTQENKDLAQANSLANLLWVAFQPYFQTKWTAGIVLETKEQGRNREEDPTEEELEDVKLSLPELDIEENNSDDPVEAFRNFFPIDGEQLPETD
jgi:hypothetical protein